jgi:hypothetical protein
MLAAEYQAAQNSIVSSFLPHDERRSSHRFGSGEPVLTCLFGREYNEEVQTLSNRSRDGLYFETHSAHYRVGMPISVSAASDSPHCWDSPAFGKVVRINSLADGNFGIAVRILMR